MTDETDVEFIDRVTQIIPEEEILEVHIDDFARIISLARRGAAQWQPIESAPRGGDFLEYQPEHTSGRLLLPARIIISGMGGSVRQSSHWMPLPPPPENARD